MTWHDPTCEWFTSRIQQCKACGMAGGVSQMHCHCASRRFPLCLGCRRGLHLNHASTEPSTGEICQCDLCTEPNEGTAA